MSPRSMGGQSLIMTTTEYNEIYINVFKAHQQLDNECDDEYIRSLLGDILDHMILLRKHNLLTEQS